MLGLKRILAALDRALLIWTQDLTTTLPSVSHRQLELYMQTVLRTAMSKALYYQRVEAVEAARTVLKAVETLASVLQESRNLDTIHVCARFAFIKAVIQMDSFSAETSLNSAVSEETFNSLLDGLRLLAFELQPRFKNQSFATLHKLRPQDIHRIHSNVL
jgi:hypothetical protein